MGLEMSCDYPKNPITFRPCLRKRKSAGAYEFVMLTSPSRIWEYANAESQASRGINGWRPPGKASGHT